MSETENPGTAMPEGEAVDAPQNAGIDVILASNSPRRKQLLEDAGVKFRVVVADVDEKLDDEAKADPEAAAKALSERKAGAVVQQILASPDLAGTKVVIGADTMVVLDGAIFGKPHSASEGKGMLRKMSGRTHRVITAVSTWMVAASDEGKVSLGHKTFAETSEVTFRQLTDEQIDDYLRLGESYDKAGAYAIQGEGAKLVESYEGDFDNIIGLPLARLLREFPDLKSPSDV